MRAVVQRVDRAEVRVAGERVAEMRAGLLALVGVAPGDTRSDAVSMARKIVNLRVFDDSEGRLNHSLVDRGYPLGVVSQFTLMADCRRGRRPSFGSAAPAEEAEPLVEAVVAAAVEMGVPVVTGQFGASMSVELVNAGPMTLLLDTRDAF
ncbi:MAG: D-tyrosyl-tRNA(Tyr) deacylase [bacterium TMED88]|nr:D-tyrosyl-tRNA(Tyr) deacylase [Deltaproteobacteria bacterium]OUV36672.1 MAG: D-tyrosyl-tRNA(Tyr) deacylase [bacterium TMED88]